MPDLDKVAVYGTLKRDMANHRLLERARFVGSDIVRSITLYDLGEYPAAVLESSNGIQVEVYELTPDELAELDRLEECDAANPQAGLYSRQVCSTRYGDAWIYIYNHAVDVKTRLDTDSWIPLCRATND